MIKLRPFEESDIPRLLGWIPDARFLLQWAGPHYQHPLDKAQLLTSLEMARALKPTHYMFTANREPDGTAIGHIELMNIDPEKKTALIGRVLIGETGCRGKGYGTEMVREMVMFGFMTLGLTEMNLGVFDFNEPAIACYKKLGFNQYEFRKNARRIDNEEWNLIMMRLTRQTWQNNH